MVVPNKIGGVKSEWTDLIAHRKEKALGEKKDSDTGRATGVDSKPTELRPVVLREAATHSREDHRGGKGQKAFHVGAC